MSDILQNAATGAALGTAIPGIGTAIGAALGAGVGLLEGIFGGNQGQTKAEHAQAESDISTYQAYLDAFPGYAAAKETEFQVQEQQTLGDRLAAMGMRGIQTGGAGSSTSAATVYSEEKSLWDTGYQQLVQQLGLEKMKVEGQLKVAKETSENTQTGGLFGHGGFLGIGI